MMMQQQIVIKVPMSGEKDKIKVRMIVAKTNGVKSMTIKGLDEDRVVVIDRAGPGPGHRPGAQHIEGLSMHEMSASRTSGPALVTGNRVDLVELTRSLRKKLGDATIVSVQNLNERVREEEDRCCFATSSSNSSYYNCDKYYPQPQCPVYYKVVEDPYTSYNYCSIM
ncbi:hypothetical protein Ddye_012236 [Dipteronia dyeriana]|uniref:Uncharacterized protein n=1 Tax=Dipteronia dyeriana TaxID=168575 RepID=A0AAD9X3X5_9ROSI|nr:hypothetical protein Ddye_012236 [Dipteronia dyeriana]